MVLKASKEETERKKIDAKLRKDYNNWNEVATLLEDFVEANENNRPRIVRRIGRKFGKGREGLDNALTRFKQMLEGNFSVVKFLQGYPSSLVERLDNRIMKTLTTSRTESGYKLKIDIKEKMTDKEILDTLDEINIYAFDTLNFEEEQTIVFFLNDEEDIKKIIQRFDPTDYIEEDVQENLSLLELLEDEYKEEYEVYPSYLVKKKLAGLLDRLFRQADRKDKGIIVDDSVDIVDLGTDLFSEYDKLMKLDFSKKISEAIDSIGEVQVSLTNEFIKIMEESTEIQRKIKEYRELRNIRNKERASKELPTLERRIKVLRERAEIVKENISKIESSKIGGKKKKEIVDAFNENVSKIGKFIDNFSKEVMTLRRMTKTKVGKKVKKNPEYGRLLARLRNRLGVEKKELSRLIRDLKESIQDIEELNLAFRGEGSKLLDVEGKIKKFPELVEQIIDSPTFTPKDKIDIEIIVRQIYRLKDEQRDAEGYRRQDLSGKGN